MYHMIKKCSYQDVFEVFCKEPTTIHFIREISKEIDLAPTSVKLHVQELLKEGLIKAKKSRPFDGFVADRDNDKFLYYKKCNNLQNLYELREKILRELYPRAIILFGSYALGEDIETSDIDIVIISDIKKDIDLKNIEKKLKRRINIIIIKNLKELDLPLQNKVMNGINLYRGF